MNEFEHLKQILKSSRRKYLKDVAIEKETLCKCLNIWSCYLQITVAIHSHNCGTLIFIASIHKQSKNSIEDKEDYEKLKSLQSYHRHKGKYAILRQKLTEKKANSSPTATAVSFIS